MKRTYSNRNLFTLAFIILLGVNLIVLLGVVSNRSGDPDFEGFLTEREMNLPWSRHDENSGLSLQVIWRTEPNKAQSEYYYRGYFPAWFNAKKLEELGYKTDNLLKSKEYHYNYSYQLPKEVYIVIEYDGAAYKNALVTAENELAEKEEKLQKNPEDKENAREFEKAKETLEEERLSKSKLFAIDAGLDQKKLREKYSDRSKYIIAKGIVKPRVYSDSRDKKNRITGTIKKLSIEKIHVPLKFKKELESIVNKHMTRGNKISPPRYKLELAYGKRLEPYIVSVRKVSTE